MPRKSEKTKILDFIVDNCEDQIADVNDADDAAVDDILDCSMEEVIIILQCRRGIEKFIPKSITWRLDVLSELDDTRLKQMLRVDRFQFTHLVGLIKTDEVFNRLHSCKQFSIELQVAVVLYRLGAYGENASIRKIASIFGIGDGSTIGVITERVFKAFQRLERKIIFWPDYAERNLIVSQTFNELPYCIGYVDGTEIALAEAPVHNHTTYFSKNRRYSIKAQVVCDHKCRIRHIVVGHVGSAHDAKVYKTCALFLEESKFFSGFQWLAGDSAYPISKTLITPYRSNSKQLDIEKRNEFNRRHSKYRVRIIKLFWVVKREIW
ncbi:uncharacterized protein LOC125776685 [Bactrocera dorsalis]|uniref:Uncharacterized protein LOC125776685 n=1 Tax=Bactrocera dorsalis TaxID=27457 RepID=A0ABM3JAC4_BACDO|nr:uncharacterized protein LOC125776685 [Bactrocera dorsalis]